MLGSSSKACRLAPAQERDPEAARHFGSDCLVWDAALGPDRTIASQPSPPSSRTSGGSRYLVGRALTCPAAVVEPLSKPRTVQDS